MRPSVAALSVLSGYQGALSIQRYKSYINLSTTHCCPAGACILRASSDSIHSNTLLSALIATRIHDPTPAKSSHSCKGIQLVGTIQTDHQIACVAD